MVLTGFSHKLVLLLWIPHSPLSTWQSISSIFSSSEVFSTRLSLNKLGSVCYLPFEPAQFLAVFLLLYSVRSVKQFFASMSLFSNRHWNSWRMELCVICLCFSSSYLIVSRWSAISYWIDVSMDGWMNGWRDGWMDGWMGRWMDAFPLMPFSSDHYLTF